MKNNKFIMVIFGASGDLTKRKLMPSLYALYHTQHLPEAFEVIGIGRTPYTDKDYQNYIAEQLKQFVDEAQRDDRLQAAFCQHLHYLTLDPSKEDQYEFLTKAITKWGGAKDVENILYYLATPPSLYGLIPQYLKKAGLNRKGSRIIVEKPFGYDLASAQELNDIYAQCFDEKQIYRIDHFLGKETAQNILAFRFANGIFEPLWNRNYIDYIEVTAAENLGIEQRGSFYEGTGALRDMVQNHLIQLLAVTAMEPPSVFNADNFRNEVVKVYESLAPLSEDDIRNNVVRGQYAASSRFKGYRQEKGVDPSSNTETFVAMKVEINNWRWSGVPFFIRTGKHLSTKVSEIIVHFKEAPHHMFGCPSQQCPRANQLVLRLQPNEGILLKFGMKVPGSGFDIKQVGMNFSYDKLGGMPVGNAYARLIEDCINGDPTLFTRSDAVEASWRFFDSVLNYWKEHDDVPLHFYKAGSWGPEASETLIRKNGGEWSNLCKNLTDTDKYCEL